LTKTKKPTGLSLSRNGAVFTGAWKIADADYGDGQSMAYRLKVNNAWSKWIAISGLKKTTTSKAFTVAMSGYSPFKANTFLSNVEFRVRGNRKKYKNKKDKQISPKVSDWSSKGFAITVPRKPSLTATLSSSHSNITTFAWSVETSLTDAQWTYDLQYETRLVANCTETNGDNAWKLTSVASTSGTTTSMKSSIDITEDTTRLASGSFTRWMRIRARGPAGASGWTYAKHVYAQPKAATGTKASATETSSGLVVKGEWTAPSNAANPIGSTTVQYTITTPVAGLKCPSGASWTDANVSADTSGKDATSFLVGQTIDEDECLFMRVNTKWDGNTTYGTPTLARVGRLKKPSGLSVSVGDTTYRATITVTNNSSVPDSFLVIVYSTGTDTVGQAIGIVPHGHTGATIQCPAWDSSAPKSFSVYAAQGNFYATDDGDGVTTYAVSANMTSERITDGGSVPLAPASVAVALTDTPGTVRVTFDWTWAGAHSAELSWADHADAWESTDEPTTYVISNLHAARWNISGLETGKTWYIRVRLLGGTNDDVTYGAYSDIKSIDLSSAPAVTEMHLQAGTITYNSGMTAAWSYVTTDGTPQAHAEIAEVVNGEYIPIGHTDTAQHITINAEEVGWAAGETHFICVNVTSASGNQSGWTDPVPITVVEPLIVAIASDSLEVKAIVTDDTTRTVNALTEMPLTIRVTGAGQGGTTTIAIERADTYQVDKPDETDRYCFEGETIALATQIGEGEVEITNDMLFGSLDDGAKYRIVATISDSLGQRDTVTKDFEVYWTHQAIAPTATVTIDSDQLIAKLTPVKPSGAAATDVCDIYRLSVDKPVLIYPGASFGTTYVDPYPAIGEFGGYRFVTRTANGDYITEDNELAWVDVESGFDVNYNIIDFGSGRVELLYEIDVSNSWKKDFRETKYLGGSVQGDWNPAVSRSSSVAAVAITAEDQDTIEAMRRLAVWPGICHVRTKDGSSYAADVQVKEDYKQADAQRIVRFGLTITRVDTEDYDGMTLAEWQETQGED
jgi:hypothetical protein